MIVLGAVAVGCTKSGLVETPQKYQEPISFDVYTGKAPTTKASIVTTNTSAAHNSETNASFHVTALSPCSYGSTYMSKDVWCSSETLTEDSQNAGYYTSWTYNGTTYWPDSGSLEFVAYGLNAKNYITWNDSHTEFTYEVPDKTSEQEDLIVAVPVTQSVANNAVKNVPINFKHLLSRVGFTLQTDTEGVQVTIKSIKLKGAFYASGVVDLMATDITADATSGIKVPEITGDDQDITSSYTLFDAAYGDTGVTAPFDCFQAASPGEAGTPIYANKKLTPSTGENVPDTYVVNENADENDRYMMIIPCTPETTDGPATIEVTYELEGAKEKTAAASLGDDFEFKAGKAYEFVISMTTASIEFIPTVAPWDEYFTDDNGDPENVEDMPVLKPIIP